MSETGILVSPLRTTSGTIVTDLIVSAAGTI
jgi:hypothetical protein